MHRSSSCARFWPKPPEAAFPPQTHTRALHPKVVWLDDLWLTGGQRGSSIKVNDVNANRRSEARRGALATPTRACPFLPQHERDRLPQREGLDPQLTVGEDNPGQTVGEDNSGQQPRCGRN